MKTRYLLPILLLCPALLTAEGWNTYRADSARSGYTPEELPRELFLQWTYRSHVPDSAWPSSGRQEFDRAFHTVISGGLLFFGSSADHKLHAIDAATGEERKTGQRKAQRVTRRQVMMPQRRPVFQGLQGHREHSAKTRQRFIEEKREETEQWRRYEKAEQPEQGQPQQDIAVAKLVKGGAGHHR